jgi:Zn-finger nucleic acid-binding protein
MFFSKKESDANTPIQCPFCANTQHQTMDRTHWRGLELDVCSHCHGIWLDFKEIALVDEVATLEEVDSEFEGTYEPNTLEAVQQELQGDYTLACPRDKTLLTRHEWRHDSKIVMDYCSRCHGLFLDPGELEGYVALSEEDIRNPQKLSEAVLDQLEEESQQLDETLEDYQKQAKEIINPFIVLKNLFNQNSYKSWH